MAGVGLYRYCDADNDSNECRQGLITDITDITEGLPPLSHPIINTAHAPRQSAHMPLLSLQGTGQARLKEYSPSKLHVQEIFFSHR